MLGVVLSGLFCKVSYFNFGDIAYFLLLLFQFLKFTMILIFLLPQILYLSVPLSLAILFLPQLRQQFSVIAQQLLLHTSEQNNNQWPIKYTSDTKTVYSKQYTKIYDNFMNF